MIFCLAGLFAAQGCSYKEMASLTDWAIAGKIAMGISAPVSRPSSTT